MHPRLERAENGHLQLTLEGAPEEIWRRICFHLETNLKLARVGEAYIGPAEQLYPSFAGEGFTLSAGWDHWSGHYLLASSSEGDECLSRLFRDLNQLSTTNQLGEFAELCEPSPLCESSPLCEPNPLCEPSQRGAGQKEAQESGHGAERPGRFIVYIEEHSNYQPQGGARVYAELSSWDEAVLVAQSVIERSLLEQLRPGLRAGELYELYQRFGDDAYVAPAVDEKSFSSSKYAMRRCAELCAG